MTSEPMPDDHVRLERDGAAAHLVLDRPSAINALTWGMIRSLAGHVEDLATAEGLRVLCLSGAGERGFCAGADVRALREAQRSGSADPAHFFRDEYALDARLADHPLTVVALMDGIVMGGGLGLSMFADARWVTERSVIAMPETIIGLYPDVGATHLLSRSPGETGTHLALSGASVSGADAVCLGLADAVVESDSLASRAANLGADPDSAVAKPEGTLDLSAPLAAEREWIDECYAGDDAAAILRRLRASQVPAAQDAAAAIEQRSPFAVTVALEMIRRAADIDTLDEQLALESRVAPRMVAHRDFDEGVRAQLVDKDKQPAWAHPDLDSVPRAEVDALFA